MIQEQGRLTCVACDSESEHGFGWRAVLIAGPEHNEERDEVAVYCPFCADFEFGEG